jgi:hypothetical protein
MPSIPAAVPHAQDPVVLSYAALRRAVGIVAVAFPFVVAVPVYILCHGFIAGSLSANYYYPTRNFFVGMLCAIATFMFCDHGYDRRDEIAGIVSSLCAFGVAFFPTTPPACPTTLQKWIGGIHYGFATILFLTLAYFCLVLFQTTAADRVPTREKLRRNLVYRICGWIILASLVIIGGLAALGHFPSVEALIAKFHTSALFESTALIAFGIAWLVKGESIPFLNDPDPVPIHTLTSNKVFGLATRQTPPLA